VQASLQQAYAALREAVDLQRRPDPTAGPAAWVDEIHELRTIVSAAAQLVRSFELGGFAATIGWSQAGPAAPPASPAAGVTPAEWLAAAQVDLADAMDHLNQAAALTGARIKLTHLV
jgi:hypothetical protein